MKKGKVVLVGTGFVGMSMAYSILNRGGVSELVLIVSDIFIFPLTVDKLPISLI